MNTRPLAELPIFAYPLLLSFAAYCSGDASGLQYIFLDFAKWLALSAGILLIVLRVWSPVSWDFLLPIAC